MANSRASVTPDTFVLLDGLRGLGAILVLVGHTLIYWGPITAPSGAIIVDMFFLLSGFVIAYAYEPRFKAGMRLEEFLTHRVVRLYPLYFLGTMLGFLGLSAMVIGDEDGIARLGDNVAQLIPQLFMLPAPEVMGNAKMYSMNSPAWTLFFELFVNIVYVMAFRWLRDTRILLGLVIACGIFLVFTVFHVGTIDVGSHWLNWWGGFARGGFAFFAGVLAYRLLGSPTTARRPVSKWALVLLVTLPIACFIPATAELRPVVDLTLVIVLGIPLLWVAQSVEPPAGYRKLFVVGGRISYAIYILHQPFREVAKRITWRSDILLDTAPLPGILILVTVVSLAYVAERYYDRPLRRFVVAWLKQRAERASRSGARVAPAT